VKPLAGDELDLRRGTGTDDRWHHIHLRAGAGGVADDWAVLAASGHLTDRDPYLVRMVGEHRVLTTDQLSALAFDSIITAQHRLGVLVRPGVLRQFRPRREVGSTPWHYLLGPAGAALLGAEDRDERKWAPQVRADRQLALVQSQRPGAHDRDQLVVRLPRRSWTRCRTRTG
jgi:Replication-relaxation